jgi:hypothetical protein
MFSNLEDDAAVDFQKRFPVVYVEAPTDCLERRASSYPKCVDLQRGATQTAGTKHVSFHL